LPNSGQDLTLLGSALDSVAVILSKNVGDVSAVLELVVIRNLEVLGVLSGVTGGNYRGAPLWLSHYYRGPFQGCGLP
jgi:hypothetical protein